MLHSVRRTDFNYLTADTVLDAEQDFSGPQQQRRTGWTMPGVRAGVMRQKPPASPSCAIRLRRHASVWPVAAARCCTSVRARCCGCSRRLMKHRMAG
jgi:hypothetical protein